MDQSGQTERSWHSDPPGCPEGPQRLPFLPALVPLPRSPKARPLLMPSREQALCPRLEGPLAGDKRKSQPSKQGSSFLASQPVLLAPWASKQEATQKSRLGNKAALSPGPRLSRGLGEGKRHGGSWGHKVCREAGTWGRTISQAAGQAGIFQPMWRLAPSSGNDFSGAPALQNPLSTRL